MRHIRPGSRSIIPYLANGDFLRQIIRIGDCTAILRNRGAEHSFFQQVNIAVALIDFNLTGFIGILVSMTVAGRQTIPREFPCIGSVISCSFLEVGLRLVIIAFRALVSIHGKFLVSRMGVKCRIQYAIYIAIQLHYHTVFVILCPLRRRLSIGSRNALPHLLYTNKLIAVSDCQISRCVHDNKFAGMGAVR